MQSEANIESVRAWLRGCEELESGVAFRIDTIDNTPNNYAIYHLPQAKSYKTDILGNTYDDPIQTDNYAFGLQLPFGMDSRQNLENASLIKTLTDWIIDQNKTRNFPELDVGKVQSIMPTTAYIADAATNSARYEITIQMRYRKGKKKTWQI